jgi:hypothetical protein
MFKFLKKLFQIVKEYDSDKAELKNRISHATEFIKDRTEIHSDVYMNSPHQVIMIGRYKNRDHVEIYEVGEGDFAELIDHLKKLKPYTTPGRFDSPWPMVHHTIDTELRT